MPSIRVLLIFVDGLGIGPENPSTNPMAAQPTKVLKFFIDDEHATRVHAGGIVVPTDACLGVDGLPQSATGQTSILTGVNAPQQVGKHINGFPTPELKEILDSESNIYSRVKGQGKSAQFANAYQPLFFKYQHKLPHSCTTISALAADLELKDFDALKKGGAVYQEFTHESLAKKGFDLPTRTPQQAGRNLARLTLDADFTVYEYFQTDRAAHSGKLEKGIREVVKLDAFLVELLDKVNLDETFVILTSDHGNIEDFSQPDHTTNPVPTILWGEDAEEFAKEIKAITDIAGVVIEILEATK